MSTFVFIDSSQFCGIRSKFWKRKFPVHMCSEANVSVPSAETFSFCAKRLKRQNE